MNLLVRAVYGLRRLATPDAAFALSVAGLLLAIEILGRQSTTDLHDLLAVTCLVLIGLVIYARHRRAPLAWVAAGLKRLHDALDRLKVWTFQMGLDMRGS